MTEVAGRERVWTVPADLVARIHAEPRPADAQSSWELSIAGYLYLGGLGAGAFIVATVAGWLGLSLAPAEAAVLGDRVWDWSPALVLWGPFVTALGASLLVFHLGRNRSLFYTACRNPRTSWLARGFLILSAFIVVGCLLALIAIAAPSWPDRLPGLWRGAEVVGVLLAFATAVYTGLLLKSVGFIPAWNATLIPFLFLASAISTGAMGVAVGAILYGYLTGDAGSAHDLVRWVEALELPLIAAEAAFLALYIGRLRRGKPEGALAARMWLSGRWRYGFWGGIVGLALALPFALTLVNGALGSSTVALAAAASVLTGGFMLRAGILAVGVKEAPPLYRLAEWRARHPKVGAGPAPERS